MFVASLHTHGRGQRGDRCPTGQQAAGGASTCEAQSDAAVARHGTAVQKRFDRDCETTGRGCGCVTKRVPGLSLAHGSCGATGLVRSFGARPLHLSASGILESVSWVLQVVAAFPGGGGGPKPARSVGLARSVARGGVRAPALRATWGDTVDRRSGAGPGSQRYYCLAAQGGPCRSPDDGLAASSSDNPRNPLQNRWFTP